MKEKIARVYKNTKIGAGTEIGDFTTVGYPPQGFRDGELQTRIGRKSILRTGTTIYAGNRIGDNFGTGHNAFIRENNIIGKNVSIGTGSILEHHIKIGDNVRIHSGAFISEYSKIEKGAWIGPRAVLTNVLHPLCPKAKACRKGPVIKALAKIGANVTILPGVVVGKKALVGAGSVVTGDIPDNSVAAGNPARVIKSIDELECKFGLIEKPY